MDLQPIPPFRLSVEERIDAAVKEAVHNALEQQRKSQECELDTLSAALQRSLAAIAGERDRALAVLLDEEEKRRTTLHDLSALVAPEMSANHLSRLTIGLERIAQELHTKQILDEGREFGSYGMPWVLQQLSQCLHSRAAAQDYLRTATQQLAEDRFEAEKELGLHHRPPSETPPPPMWSAARGVTLARAAAADALRPSLMRARERVEYLEQLIRESGAQGDDANKTETAVTAHNAEAEAVRVNTSHSESMANMITAPEFANEQKGGSNVPATEKNVTLNIPCSVACKGEADVYESIDDRSEEASNGGETSAISDDQGLPEVLTSSIASGSHPVRHATDFGKRQVAVEGRDVAGQRASIGLQRTRSSDQAGQVEVEVEAETETDSMKQRECDSVKASSNRTMEDARNWQLASRRAEASLTDMKAMVKAIVKLSFACGKEHAVHRQREIGPVPTELGLVDGFDLVENQMTSPTRETREDDEAGVANGGDGYNAEDEDASPGTAGSQGASLDTAEDTKVPEKDAKRRCIPEMCPSCRARTSAMEHLLQRLQGLSVDQAKGLARVTFSLDQLCRDSSGSRDESARSEISTSLSTADDAGKRDLMGSESKVIPADAGPLRDEPQIDHADPRTHGRAFEESITVRPPDDSRPTPPSTGTNQHDSFYADDIEGRADGVRETAAARRDVRTEWHELEALVPTPLSGPSGGLGSAAVQGVLDRWIDVGKRRILEGWLAHILHGGPVNAANGCFVPRVQISSLSKEVRDGLVSSVLPILLRRRGVLLQVLTRERVELVHDVQIRVTPITGRKDANVGQGRMPAAARRRAPVGEREHGARVRDMVMKAAHAGYVDEDEFATGEGRMWTPLSSVDTVSRQLRDTWDTFNSNLSSMSEPRRGQVQGRGKGRPVALP